MKKLINDVIERLAEAQSIPEMPARTNDRLYEYVDVDWGQADFYEAWPPPVKFPAALVDVVESNPNDMGLHIQINMVQLQVRVIELVLSNSSYRAPDAQREKAFRVFDLVWATNRLLHGWTGGAHYGPLTRAGFSKINRKDGLREYRMLYNVQLTDSSAEIVYPKAPAVPVVRLAVK